MNGSHFYALVALFLLAMGGAQVAAQTNAPEQEQGFPIVSLDSLIRRAKSANFEILAAQNAALQAQNNANPGLAGLLPTLSVNAGYNRSLTNTFIEFAIEGREPISESWAGTQRLTGNLVLNYNLFDGFRNFNTYERSQEFAEQTEATTLAIRDNVLSRLIIAYYDAARLQAQTKIAEKAVRLSEERYAQLQLRNEYGGATAVEVLNAKVDLNTDSTALIANSLEFLIARRSIALILAQTNTDFAIDTNVQFRTIGTFDELLESALRRNPQYVQTQQALNVARLDDKIAGSFYYPQLNFSLQYGITDSRNDVGLILMTQNTGLTGDLSLNFPIFDAFERSIRSQNAEIAVNTAQVQLEQMTFEIRNALQVGYDTYRTRLRLLELEESNVSTSRANFEVSKASFEMGQITGLQLREAQLNLLRSLSRLNEAKFAAKASEVELLRIAGTLSDYYH